MKILVAADGSTATGRMLDYLAAHEEWLALSHQYTVVHCMLPVPPRAAVYFGNKELQSYYSGESEAVFKPVRAFFKSHDIEATFASHIESPGDAISRLAEEGKFDLVMMGSHGHGALANLVLGSVATRVLAKCQTPVLIVR